MKYFRVALRGRAPTPSRCTRPIIVTAKAPAPPLDSADWYSQRSGFGPAINLGSSRSALFAFAVRARLQIEVLAWLKCNRRDYRQLHLHYYYYFNNILWPALNGSVASEEGRPICRQCFCMRWEVLFLWACHSEGGKHVINDFRGHSCLSHYDNFEIN